MPCNPLVSGKKVVGFICSPTIKEFGRKYQHCIGCKRKRYFWCTFAEWYGWDGTCLTCGEQFFSEEWGNRPFKRGWRKNNIEWARERMKEMMSPGKR